jgi:hypothetical protein
MAEWQRRGQAMVLDPQRSLWARDKLSQYLRPGEELLWYGQPDRSVIFAPADAFAVPFSILWLAFAVFWESAAVGPGGDAFAAVWGLPFIAVGCYATVGRFVYKRRRKAKTYYGVTRERAIIVTGNSVSDIPLTAVPMSVSCSRDGSHASVTFGNLGLAAPASRAGERRRQRLRQQRRRNASYANTGMEPFARGANLPFAFYDVADPDALIGALDNARAANTW